MERGPKAGDYGSPGGKLMDGMKRRVTDAALLVVEVITVITLVLLMVAWWAMLTP